MNKTDRTLHPTVTLAEGVVVSEDAWQIHGHILTGGIPNHDVLVMGFPPADMGVPGIRVQVSVRDRLEHLRRIFH